MDLMASRAQDVVMNSTEAMSAAIRVDEPATVHATAALTARVRHQTIIAHAT